MVYWDNVLVALCSMLPNPSGTVKHGFRCHRLVVLPDYQGLGFGTKITEYIADIYLKEGKRFYFRTTHKKLLNHMDSSDLWVGTSHNNKPQTTDIQGRELKTKKRICGSYEYVGNDYISKPHKEIVIDEINDLNKLKNYLISLQKQYYVIIIHGKSECDDEIDILCQKLAIRTKTLYIKKKDTYTKKKIPKNVEIYKEN